jgi:phage protein D
MMDGQNARRAAIELYYKGKNITDYIEKDLQSFTYTDVASGEADSVSIELNDIEKKWIGDWAPAKGDTIEPTIIVNDWEQYGDNQKLYCGKFLVDEPGYSGPPRMMSLGAVSVPANTNFMDVLNNHAWDSASVKKIAETIAKKSKLSLKFVSSYNPVIKRVEQNDTADVSFLYDLCQSNGLSMKVYSNTIIIFYEPDYESADAVMTITEEKIKGWSAKTTFTDTGYDGCLIQYTEHKRGKTHKYTFWAPGHKGGPKVCKINERAENLAEAQRLAKAKLRELNKAEYTITITMVGNTKLYASQTVMIDGFGRFDGKYYIDKIDHNLPGYEITITLHKCLEGY